MIGVVGPEPVAARFADAIADSDGTATVGAAHEIADASPAAVVAIGETAVIDLARLGIDAPVLPVDAGTGLGSVAEDATDAVDSIVRGEYETEAHPVLDVRRGGEPVDRALFDVMLVTAKPSQISEYCVATDGRRERFRADGVVVATPAGSRGYARAAGGPVLQPDVRAVAVVPVGAFEIGAGSRVVEPPLSLSVERNDHPVALMLDGDEAGTISEDRSVRIGVDGGLQVVVPRRGLEKL